MSCVPDRVLWLIQDGEDRPLEQAHVRTCLGCAARYERLARDLDVLGQALRALPADRPVRRPVPAPGWGGLAVAATLVVLIALAGVAAWRAKPSRLPVAAAPAGAPVVVAAGDVLPFLGEVAVALSPAGPLALAGSDSTWLGEEDAAAPASADLDMGSLFTWDPSIDVDGDRDSGTESET